MMNFESCKRGRTGYFHFLVSWLLNFLLFLRSSEDLSQILGQASKRAPGVAPGALASCWRYLAVLRAPDWTAPANKLR